MPRRHPWLPLPAAALALLLASAPAAARECVVLLHGLGRDAGSLGQIEEALRSAGYDTANVDYPSREHSVQALAASAVGEGLAACRAKTAETISFVTHSLGGILVRQYFQDQPAGEVRRVVMLAPPNHGSEVVDRHRDAWWFRKMTGVAGQELGTAADSTPNRLRAIPLEIGIIAGTTSSDPWFSSSIPGDDDGKVSTASARLAEMRDYIEVPHGHTFLMRADDVIAQTLHFLANGAFLHTDVAAK